MPSLPHTRRPKKSHKGNFLSLNFTNLIFTHLDKLPSQLPAGQTLARFGFTVQSFSIKESISSEGRSVRELLMTAPFKQTYDNQIGVMV
jgi:hypothetical protein